MDWTHGHNERRNTYYGRELRPRKLKSQERGPITAEAIPKKAEETTTGTKRSAIKREVTCITPISKKRDEEHIAQCSYEPARRFCLTKVMHTLARYIITVIPPNYTNTHSYQVSPTSVRSSLCRQ